MMIAPIQMIETPELPSHLFLVEVTETRRYRVFVRVLGEPSEEKAREAAQDHADDCVDSGVVSYDCNREANAAEQAPLTEFERNTFGVENINAAGEYVELLQPIPPASARFKFGGVDWACNRHMLIQVDAYPEGIGCVKSGEWQCLDLDQARAAVSQLDGAIANREAYEPMPNSGPCFQARYFQYLVRPGDRFALAQLKQRTDGGLFLFVIRDGAPVAALLNAATNKPCVCVGVHFDHLANILADLAKERVPS